MNVEKFGPDDGLRKYSKQLESSLQELDEATRQLTNHVEVPVGANPLGSLEQTLREINSKKFSSYSEFAHLSAKNTSVQPEESVQRLFPTSAPQPFTDVVSKTREDALKAQESLREAAERWAAQGSFQSQQASPTPSLLQSAVQQTEQTIAQPQEPQVQQQPQMQQLASQWAEQPLQQTTQQTPQSQPALPQTEIASAPAQTVPQSVDADAIARESEELIAQMRAQAASNEQQPQVQNVEPQQPVVSLLASQVQQDANVQSPEPPQQIVLAQEPVAQETVAAQVQQPQVQTVQQAPEVQQVQPIPQPAEPAQSVAEQQPTQFAEVPGLEQALFEQQLTASQILPEQQVQQPSQTPVEQAPLSPEATPAEQEAPKIAVTGVEFDRKDLRKEHKKNIVATFAKDLGVVVVASIVLSFLIKSFLFMPFIIPSGSMENTLQVDDKILTFKLKPALMKVEHGDVVVFKDTKNWLSAGQDSNSSDNPVTSIAKFIGLMPEDDNSYLVKRAIGLPGDHVTCKGSGSPIFVNGQQINEPYLKEGVQPSVVAFDVTVPDNALFVLGDNRANSADSRYNTKKPGEGFVSERDVVGVAFLTMMPFDRFHRIPDEHNAFEGVNKK